MFYAFTAVMLLVLWGAGWLLLTRFKNLPSRTPDITDWEGRRRNPLICIPYGVLAIALAPFLILDKLVDMPHTGYYDGRDR